MRSILEGKIYLIRNFQKEKLNNLIMNNKLTLRIFLQNQSLYRKEHLKYLLSGIDTSVEENSTKKSTVLLFNSLGNRRGSLLSLLDSKSTYKSRFLGARRMSSRRLIGVIPPPIDTSQPSPSDSAQSPATWSPNPPCPPVPSNITNERSITNQAYPPLPASDGDSVVSEEEDDGSLGPEGDDSDTETTEGEDENSLNFAISPLSQEGVVEETPPSESSDGWVNVEAALPPSESSDGWVNVEAALPPSESSDGGVNVEAALPPSESSDGGVNVEPPLPQSAAEIIVRGTGTLISVVWEWFTGSSG